MYNKVKDWHERVRFGFLQYPLKNHRQCKSRFIKEREKRDKRLNQKNKKYKVLVVIIILHL